MRNIYRVTKRFELSWYIEAQDANTAKEIVDDMGETTGRLYTKPTTCQRQDEHAYPYTDEVAMNAKIK